MKRVKFSFNIIFSVAIALTIMFVPYSANAQEGGTDDPLTADFVETDLVDEAVEVESTDSDYRNWRFSILGGPGYTPDYGFLLGGSALMTFDMAGMKGFERRSVLPLAFSLSLGDYVGLSAVLRPQLFMKQDKIRLMGEFYYSNLSSNYYGVGYDTNKNVERGESTTQYFSSQISINPILLFRLANSDWFMGPTFHLQHDNVRDPAQGIIEDPDYILVGGDADGYKTLNNGLGMSFNYDSRDIPANAYSGVYFDVKALFYGDYLGGDHNYQQLNIKYRQYMQLSKRVTGRTLAWNIYTDNIFGDAPFTRLSLAGSPFDLRGYYRGQYRDKSTHVAMVEYRHDFHVTPVSFLTKLADRLGFVTWAGVGALGSSPFDIDGVLPNYGVGLRIEVQPRMNFRIDMGFSPVDKQRLIYFNMTEAF